MDEINSELRQNKLTNEWVIFAPNRGARPKETEEEKTEEGAIPAFDKNCPFCPGNESMLPDILLELPFQAKTGWQIRVVPNKYPALQPSLNRSHNQHDGFFSAHPGYGRHEVIIEHPQHNRDIPQMSVEEVEQVIVSYQNRWLILTEDPEIQFAALFRNHGPTAGTSLIHPHSQLIAVGIIPRNELLQRRIAQDYYKQHNRCLLCDLLNHESTGPRMVFENDDFSAFVPFAAEAPFEMLLAPKAHNNNFGAISNGEKRKLAEILPLVLSRLCQAAGDPDYNYVIHSQLKSSGDDFGLHWYMNITPRTTKRAGFEIGSGMHINPSLPEEDAHKLRGKAILR
jgi:UDPglucose--hexose-1-phosphate uridylyltransferase